MRKFLKFASLFLALGAFTVLQSCDEENIEPAPTVEVDPTAASNIPGAKVSANLIITAPNGAQTLSVFVAGTQDQEIDLTAVDIDSPVPYEYTIPANAVVGSKIIISFQVIDAKNYPSAIANFVITVGDPVVTLQGTLTTQTLDATKPYLLKGQVFIPAGVTLTIPEGTVIKGDKSTKATLIVQPGGKLIANGTAAKPIVFTSAQNVGERDRGDWGGVVLLGNAFVNQTAKPFIEGITPSQSYGSVAADGATPTTNATENSGILKYVRIEYAGIELTPNNETNSLTMGAIGSGTTIEYVQTSFGGDDGFEWFGGTVNGKYLVSHSTWDDDFDTDYGWGGNVQFGLVVRNPFFADQSGSNAFESDNQGTGNAIAGLCDASASSAGSATGCTRGVFSNITVLGPREANGRTISANYQNAMHIRRRSSISLFNSFISGFRIGLRIDDDGTYFNLAQGNAKHANNVLATAQNSGNNVTAATSATASDGLFLTNIRFAAANDGTIDPAVAAGNATPISNYWASANASFNVAAVTTPITDLGISANQFWGNQSAASFLSNPNFALSAGVAGNNNLNSGASFTDPKLSGAFFTATTFRGAFGSTDWTDGWAEFQPLNKAY